MDLKNGIPHMMSPKLDFAVYRSSHTAAHVHFSAQALAEATARLSEDGQMSRLAQIFARSIATECGFENASSHFQSNDF